MKEVFVSQNLIEVEVRKERLEQAGIRRMIKNQCSSGLAGEIPFAEVFPELWVLQDDDYDQARQLPEEEPELLPANQDSWHARDAENVTRVDSAPVGTVDRKGCRIDFSKPEVNEFFFRIETSRPIGLRFLVE